MHKLVKLFATLPTLMLATLGFQKDSAAAAVDDRMEGAASEAALIDETRLDAKEAISTYVRGHGPGDDVDLIVDPGFDAAELDIGDAEPDLVAFDRYGEFQVAVQFSGAPDDLDEFEVETTTGDVLFASKGTGQTGNGSNGSNGSMSPLNDSITGDIG